MENLITIAVFNLPSEIVVLRSVLENKDIFHFFENETVVSIDPLASLAYGGIKLKIHPSDAEIVQKILDDFSSNLKVV